MAGWKAVGGNWEIANGAIYNHSHERGSKLLTGSSEWGNYAVNADVQFNGDNADMGVIIRTNDEKKEGSDTYDGYYIGLRTLDQTLVIGRSDFGWTEAPPVAMPGGVHASVWYRLHVIAYGCNIAASAQNLTTSQTVWLAFNETSCIKTGHIGLRSLNDGMWSNISIAPAGWNDYMALRRHAASVERPEVMPGPPWWTPWHVGMLFVGTLAIALLIQLIYFRIQQWKVYTINCERARLAHDIHDTMAQNFSGVGYQIQGIRSSVIRGTPLDSKMIADQLSVAYQLVCSCHKEASRTIALLSSASRPMQHDLLGTLAKTARNIAGDRIKICAELHGSSATLSLRLANALMHIGQEAIANAMSHANPSILKISLVYEANSVELVVEDNGQGFDYAQKQNGFGLLGMQRRAHDVAGSMDIISTPGHGTKIRVKAKLQPDKPQKRTLACAKYMLQNIMHGFKAQ
jgi:signal transduction histidine kinase